LALAGVITVIVSLALIFTNATWIKTSQSKGRQFVNITYEQKGYGYAFLAGLGLFRRRRDAEKGKVIATARCTG